MRSVVAVCRAFAGLSDSLSSCGGRVGDHLVTSFRRERAHARAIRAVLYHASISLRKLAKAHREREKRESDGHPIIENYRTPGVYRVLSRCDRDRGERL